MKDSESPDGMRIIYDLLVKAAEYPGESSHNLANVFSWGQKIKALHELLSLYFDEEYTREYKIARDRLLEVSKMYPSERYVSESYDLLFAWFGSISRLYGRLGLLIPMNYTYTEGGEEGI
jgi:hypothetical protein